MEKAALMRSLSFLQQSGLSIDAIVTDRHPAIQKYLRDAAPSIHHYYDVWHVAKGKPLFLIHGYHLLSYIISLGYVPYMLSV